MKPPKKKILVAWMVVHQRVDVGMWEEPYDRVRSGIWLLKSLGSWLPRKHVMKGSRRPQK